MRAASAARALSLARSSLKTRPDGSAASSAGTSPVCSGVSVAAVSAAAASGGASAAGVSSAAGRPLSVRAPSRRARPFPQARAVPGHSGRRARWVRQRPPGRGSPAVRTCFRIWARQAPARRERGCPVRGLALRGLVSRGFFRRLSSLRRLGLCGFCCLCAFFWPAASWGTRQAFLWSARLRRAARRCPSAQGACRRQTGGWLPCGAGASAWGPPPAVPQWISYLLPYSHSLF